MDQLDQDIYDMWAELYPDLAFRYGDKNKAGDFFIPTEENIERMQRRIGGLKVDTIDTDKLGLLTCFETKLKFHEPYQVLYDAIWAYFGYLVKEGISIEHLTKLTRNLIRALNSQNGTNKNKSWSTEIKIVTYNNYLGLIGIIDSMAKKAPELKSLFNELRSELKEYIKKFEVTGIKNGDFAEVFPALESKGGNIGRKEIYPYILRDMYGFLEEPDEIETTALNWLNSERPSLLSITEKLAKIFEVDNTIEAVTNKIKKRSDIDKQQLLETIEKLRLPLRKLMEENIVRITPKYDTRVIETPDYLLNQISTAAMTAFDVHTDKPFNIFFVTTNNKRSPPTNLSELFQLIIHEEFGHCVHFSNSAARFDAEISLVDLLKTTLALSISDGISFHREWESLSLLRRIIKKPEAELNETEKEFLYILKTVSDPNLFLLESEFTIYRWRIIRFLRAIADIRINMHKQTIAEFINWANEYTGISKKSIFDQIFLFMAMPGYAPVYSIVGDRIRELQERAKNHGRNEIDFNTYASSLGFPLRSVFEQKLKDY
jgi:hypothetical protein